MPIITPDPLSLYCDAGGTDESEIMVVAGSVSSVSRWSEFDKEWRQALDDNNLRFSGWASLPTASVSLLGGKMTSRADEPSCSG